MKYPVLIHKDAGSEFGVTIPDVPGCFTTGKTIEEALKNLQEAVICYYEGEDITVPPESSKIEELITKEELFIDGGFWMLADIDFFFSRRRPSESTSPCLRISS